jgi:hypothetical protein
MKHSIELDSLSLKELSVSEKRNTIGGKSTLRFVDSYGYTWIYDYNDAGDLVGYGVYQGYCVN